MRLGHFARDFISGGEADFISRSCFSTVFLLLQRPLPPNSSIPTAWRKPYLHFATKLESLRDLSYSQINLCALASLRENLFQEAKPTLFREAYFDLFLYFIARISKFFHTYGMEGILFTFCYQAQIPTGFTLLTKNSSRLGLFAGEFISRSVFH
ncbi:hypothetical protein SAMN04488519_103145 [Algoriphagus ornithinivorans]|uniref:Uncharacterized protein n=1 Tax=Algoriphagus ornithinivorans TaxID=226506 RepID=A0A1I5DTL6_9BACT|nr:hypothetical protein SAMN04488519_103145 [Algoriphagus ornithinivorans]